VKRAFVKMQGAGNDYIYFDCFAQPIKDPGALSLRLSDRHFGIGGDGIVLMEASAVADARMRMFNADGSEAKMCGNGVRCVGKFVYDNGIARKEILNIDTNSGIKRLKMIIKDGVAVAARVDMGKAIIKPSEIPVKLDGDSVIDRSVMISGSEYRITCVSMGNPHCVVFVDDVDSLDLPAIGSRFENDPIFPDRVNTEFVQVINRKQLKMRVWERGSGETLACGTGTCASVVAATLCGYCDKGTLVEVELRGGKLVIEYTDETVFMTGGVETVFKGEIE
jgi:diaminopimelate epimerase